MRFWLAEPAYSTRDLWVGPRDHGPNLGQRIAERVADGWQPDPAIALKPFNNGKRLHDFLHTGGSFFMVVSQRFIQLLEEIEATGWTARQVDFRDRKGEPIAGYRLMVTTGRCDRFFNDDGEPDGQPADPSVGWDGSDIFWFEPPSNGFITTDRVKEAIEEAGLTGFDFEVPTT